jgi:hypothetical protein
VALIFFSWQLWCKVLDAVDTVCMHSNLSDSGVSLKKTLPYSD